MLVCIHQPNFIPWLGFFDKVARSDRFLVMDNVQYPKNCWVNRVKIAGNGPPLWLTVPVKRTGLHTRICETEIDYAKDWVKKGLTTLAQRYRKHPGFDDVFPPLEQLLSARPSRLADLNLSLLAWVMKLTGIETPLARGSRMQAGGKASELIVAMLREAGADGYLAGQGAQDYEDLSEYRQAGIEYVQQNFQHPVYPQLHQAPFVPGLSILDVLFNLGIEKTRSLLHPPT